MMAKVRKDLPIVSKSNLAAIKSRSSLVIKSVFTNVGRK